MSEESKNTTGWGKFGKFSAVAILVYTLVVTGITVYSKFFASEKANLPLEVTLFAQPFQTPPTTNSKDKEHQRSPYARGDEYEGYMVFTIRNSGGGQADNVVIDLP